MGTDVYLDWKGRTREDKEKQFTGFCIDAGNIGYLSASVGMTTENTFLRRLFPNEYWEAGKAVRYNFTEEGYKKLQMAGLAYLVSSITNSIVVPFTVHHIICLQSSRRIFLVGAARLICEIY